MSLTEQTRRPRRSPTEDTSTGVGGVRHHYREDWQEWDRATKALVTPDEIDLLDSIAADPESDQASMAVLERRLRTVVERKEKLAERQTALDFQLNALLARMMIRGETQRGVARKWVDPKTGKAATPMAVQFRVNPFARTRAKSKDDQ